MEIFDKIQSGVWQKQIEAIRKEEDKDKRKALKSSLPCVTFSGVFSPRQTSGLKAYNHFVTLDVDIKAKGKISRLKRELMKDWHVAAFFDSPNRGLKVFVNVTSAPEHHRECAFPIIEMYMTKHYDVEIDSSGKNIDRLCFVSYDPDLFYRDDYVTFPVDTNWRPEIEDWVRTNTGAPEGTVTSYDSNHIFDTCVRWAEKRFVYSKGDRNNFLHALACNLNRCGINEMSAINMIHTKYHPKADTGFVNSVKAVYRRNNREYNTVQVYRRRDNQQTVF